ncbi:MAG: MCE family protein [Gammaproteobacteria bacterium]|nr:MAG: MCE family protein [Gammaproteobacteria bacterium]
METRVQYVLVGLFVILLGGAGIAISLWLAFGDVTEHYRTYRVYMDESVTGLYVDAPVRYRGVEVGKVKRIELDPADPQRVILTLAIREGVPIHQDTYAELRAQGLTGIASIELAGGSPESPLLEPSYVNPEPVIRAGPSLFKRLDDAVSELIANLNRASKDLDRLLSPDNRQRISASLAHIEQITARLARDSEALSAGIRDAGRFFHRAAEVTEEVPALIADVRRSARSVQSMAVTFQAAGETLRVQSRAGGEALQSLQHALEPKLDTALETLTRLAENLDRLVRRLDENPSLLLRGEQLPPGPGE